MNKRTLLSLTLAAVFSLPILALADPITTDSGTLTGEPGVAGGGVSAGDDGTDDYDATPGETGEAGGRGGNAYDFSSGVLIITGGSFTGGTGGSGGTGGMGGTGSTGGDGGAGGPGGVGGNGGNGLYLAFGTTVTISGGSFDAGIGGVGGTGGTGGTGSLGGTASINGGNGGTGGNGSMGGVGGAGGPGGHGRDVNGSDGNPGNYGISLRDSLSGAAGWGIYDDGATIEFQGYSYVTGEDTLSRPNGYLVTIP